MAIMVRAVDVAVVGAGLSGLTTAGALLQRNPGLRVLVLEGRPHVGGRLESVDARGCGVGADGGRDRIDLG